MDGADPRPLAWISHAACRRHDAGPDHSEAPLAQQPGHDAHCARLADGGRFDIAPARPVDAQGLLDLLQQATPGEIRLRFFHCIRVFHPALVETLLRDDDELHVALVARPAGEAAGRIVATAMLAGLPGHTEAEFALLVHRSCAQRGLGRHLLECLIAAARRRGFRRVYGLVMRENELMLQLAREMNAHIRPDPGEPDCLRVEWSFDEHAATAATLRHANDPRDRAR